MFCFHLLLLYIFLVVVVVVVVVVELFVLVLPFFLLLLLLFPCQNMFAHVQIKLEASFAAMKMKNAPCV